MRLFDRMAMRLRMLFERPEAGAQLDAELRDHLDRQIAENLAAGMSVRDARFLALRSFGNPALLREQARATWSWNWLESLLRDLRYGARTLRRSPGFSVIAVVVRSKCAAECRRYAEHGEEISRAPRGVNLFGELSSFSGDVVLVPWRDDGHLCLALRGILPQ